MSAAREEGGALDDTEHAGRNRVFLLPPVSAVESKDPHAPLGTGHDVQSAGASFVSVEVGIQFLINRDRSDCQSV